MNDTAPHSRTPHIPGPRTVSRAPYPRRISYEDPNKAGLVVGSTPEDITAAQRWARNVTRRWAFTPAMVDNAAAVAAALVANAHQHTASGLPGGETTLTLEYGEWLTSMWVVDQGPRPSVIRPPLPHTRPGGSGLSLVERVAVYWEWELLPPGIAIRAALETPQAPPPPRPAPRWAAP